MPHGLTPSRTWRPWALLCLCLSLLWSVPLITACGGGGVGEDGTGAPVKATSVGTVTGISSDSITVNEQTYALPASVQVSDAMVGSLSTADIQPGMWVQVQGQSEANGEGAVALSIQLVPSVRGQITQVDAGQATLTVLGTTVNLGANTWLNTPDAQLLQVGDTIEVHGVLDTTLSQIAATRVTLLNGNGNGSGAELRGKVSALNLAQATMMVGDRLVSLAQASIALPRALSDGMVVRVSSRVAPLAGQTWAVDRILPGQDIDLSVNATFAYVEGFVDDWAAGPAFSLGGLPVNASGANGRVAVTQNGLRVAVIGALRDGRLQAKSVAIVNAEGLTRFTLIGEVSDLASAADFRVRGVQVDASLATYTAGEASQLANGRRVRVDGTLQGRAILASKMKILSP